MKNRQVTELPIYRTDNRGVAAILIKFMGMKNRVEGLVVRACLCCSFRRPQFCPHSEWFQTACNSNSRGLTLSSGLPVRALALWNKIKWKKKKHLGHFVSCIPLTRCLTLNLECMAVHSIQEGLVLVSVYSALAFCWGALMLLDSVAFATEVSVARTFMHVLERTTTRDHQSLGFVCLQISSWQCKQETVEA